MTSDTVMTSQEGRRLRIVPDVVKVSAVRGLCGRSCVEGLGRGRGRSILHFLSFCDRDLGRWDLLVFSNFENERR